MIAATDDLRQRRGPRLGGATPPSRTPAHATHGCWPSSRSSRRARQQLPATSCSPATPGLPGPQGRTALPTAPARATSAHIALIGHITQAELQDRTEHDRARQRVHKPPDLDRVPAHQAAARRRQPQPLAGTGMDLLAGTLQHARQAGELRLDKHARALVVGRIHPPRPIPRRPTA